MIIKVPFCEIIFVENVFVWSQATTRPQHNMNLTLMNEILDLNEEIRTFYDGEIHETVCVSMHAESYFAK